MVVILSMVPSELVRRRSSISCAVGCMEALSSIPSASGTYFAGFRVSFPFQRGDSATIKIRQLGDPSLFAWPDSKPAAMALSFYRCASVISRILTRFDQVSSREDAQFSFSMPDGVGSHYRFTAEYERCRSQLRRRPVGISSRPQTEETRTKAKELGAGTVRSNSSEFRDDTFLTIRPFEVELSKLRTDPKKKLGTETFYLLTYRPNG